MTYKPKQLSITGKKGGPKKIASLNDAYIKEHYSGDSSLPKRPKKPTLPKIRLPGGLERQKTDAPSGKGKIFSYSTPGNKVYEGKKWNPTNKKGGTKTTLKSLSKGTKKFKQTPNYKNTISSILGKKSDKKVDKKPDKTPNKNPLWSAKDPYAAHKNLKITKAIRKETRPAIRDALSDKPSSKQAKELNKYLHSRFKGDENKFKKWFREKKIKTDIERQPGWQKALIKWSNNQARKANK